MSTVPLRQCKSDHIEMPHNDGAPLDITKMKADVVRQLNADLALLYSYSPRHDTHKELSVVHESSHDGVTSEHKPTEDEWSDDEGFYHGNSSSKAPGGPNELGDSALRKNTAKKYAIATRKRRIQQEYENFHNPPSQPWICGFHEYEDIFGEPPRAMIRQYEIKDRKERKRLAEKRHSVNSHSNEVHSNDSHSKVSHSDDSNLDDSASDGSGPNSHSEHADSHASDPEPSQYGGSNSDHSKFSICTQKPDDSSCDASSSTSSSTSGVKHPKNAEEPMPRTELGLIAQAQDMADSLDRMVANNTLRTTRKAMADYLAEIIRSERPRPQ